MSYMGLFWETGMPEAWALSRKSVDGPAAETTFQSWPQDMLGGGMVANPPHVVPGDNAGRPVPTPDDGKTEGK